MCQAACTSWRKVWCAITRPRPTSGGTTRSSTSTWECSVTIPFDLLLIQVINGIVTGMILALVASGLTLIFGIMDVVNFAHGELFMLGAYLGSTVFLTTGNFWLALGAAVMGIGLLGAVIQTTTLRPLLGRDPLTTILATFGLSLVLQNYALWQYGPVPRKINEPITGHFSLFYLEYPWYRLLVAVLSAAIIGGLWLFMKYGKYGIWIRATTQDRVMAAAMGIPVPLVHTVVFAIGAAMAAASGVLFGPLTGVNHAMSLDILIGYTGMVSFGHSAFFGLGMYGAAAALLTVRQPNLWLAILYGLVGAGAVAVFVAYFSTRLRDIYFAITTLVFSQIFYVIIFTWTEVTGGENGLGFSQPAFAIPGVVSARFTPVTLP